MTTRLSLIRKTRALDPRFSKAPRSVSSQSSLFVYHKSSVFHYIGWPAVTNLGRVHVKRKELNPLLEIQRTLSFIELGSGGVVSKV